MKNLSPQIASILNWGNFTCIILLSVGLCLGEEKLGVVPMTISIQQEMQAMVAEQTQNATPNFSESTENPDSFLGEQAPLAYFALAALAVGGVFYAIQQDSKNPRVQTQQNRNTNMQTALFVAALTGVTAGGAYLYYSFHTP